MLIQYTMDNHVQHAQLHWVVIIIDAENVIAHPRSLQVEKPWLWDLSQSRYADYRLNRRRLLRYHQSRIE